MATCRTYFYRRVRHAFSFPLRLDGYYRIRAFLRRQRIDVGAYENYVFPYVLFRPYSVRVRRERGRRILVCKTNRHAYRRNAYPRILLHLQRRVRYFARLAEYPHLFLILILGVFCGIPAFQARKRMQTPLGGIARNSYRNRCPVHTFYLYPTATPTLSRPAYTRLRIIKMRADFFQKVGATY